MQTISLTAKFSQNVAHSISQQRSAVFQVLEIKVRLLCLLTDRNLCSLFSFQPPTILIDYAFIIVILPELYVVRRILWFLSLPSFCVTIPIITLKDSRLFSKFRCNSVGKCLRFDIWLHRIMAHMTSGCRTARTDPIMGWNHRTATIAIV